MQHVVGERVLLEFEIVQYGRTQSGPARLSVRRSTRRAPDTPCCPGPPCLSTAPTLSRQSGIEFPMGVEVGLAGAQSNRLYPECADALRIKPLR